MLGDEIKIGLAHVRADELDSQGELLADQGEELGEAFLGAFLAHPQQANALELYLVDQCEVVVTAPVGDLVHADGADRAELAVLEPPLHDIFDRLAHMVPGGVETQRRLLLRQLACPVRQVQHVGVRQGVLAEAPGHLFDLYAAVAALHAPHAIQ